MPRRASLVRSDTPVFPADPASASGPAVRDRLLMAGERLFAEHGLGVSVRSITAEARVNLAALHYYFGSKEGLLEAIFETRARPIAADRLALLAECGTGSGRPPLLEQVLTAYLRPALTLGTEPRYGGPTFARLRARMTVESQTLAQRVAARAFNESSRAYLDKLCRLLPGLAPEEVAWRFHFLLGAMFYCMAAPNRIAVLTGNAFTTSDGERGLACLVTFLAAGFNAPATQPASRPGPGADETDHAAPPPLPAA